MDTIIKLYFRQRIDQICKSFQSMSIGETTSAENVESVNVSKEYLEVLNISHELKTQRATALLKRKDLIDTTESKIEILFQNIITLEAEEKDRKFDDIIALATTYFNMGLVYSDTELQDLVISETYLTTCMTLLKEKVLERKVIVTIIRVLIKLSIISHKRKQPEKSYSFLNTAMELYSKYTKEEIKYPEPINFNAILGMNNEKGKNSKVVLENLQLITLLNMSTLYAKNSRNKHKFVIYVHNILDQLTETIPCTFITYSFYWAMTSCHLSKYFLYNYRFAEARNHMIAAEYMMKMFYEHVIEPLSNEEIDAKLYSFVHKLHETGYNNVLKFWGIYGAELLTASANGLLQIEENNKSCETDNSKSESVTKCEEDVTKLLIFSDVRKEFEGFTARFPDKCVSSLNDAKTIFVDVLKCFDTVKKYFIIEEYLIDFVEIAIRTSKLYQCLATFEPELDKSIKLKKRQKEILENVWQELLNRGEEFANTRIYSKIMMKLVSEWIAEQNFHIDMQINNLFQLNIEHLDRYFADEKTVMYLKQLVMNSVIRFQYFIKFFDTLKTLNELGL